MGVKSINLTFDEKTFEKIEKAKTESGLTWEDYLETCSDVVSENKLLLHKPPHDSTRTSKI